LLTGRSAVGHQLLELWLWLIDLMFDELFEQT
jgi:hypothetical protein